jgi:hypothetical protein
MVIEMFSSPGVLENTTADFLRFLGALAYAIVIVVVGWLIGSIVSEILRRILNKVKLNEFLKSHKVHGALGSTKIENVLVQLAKYYIIILFLADALRIVQLGTIGQLMNDIVGFAPVLFGGILVVVVAALLGELAKEKILEVSAKSSLTKLSAKLAKVVIIYVGFVVAMGTMGFDVLILQQAFSILLQGLVYGIALAIGISFGFGGQDEAKDVLKKTRKKFNL